MNFISNAIKSNAQIFYGVIGGAIMFGGPAMVYEYVRPILHSLY